MNLQELSLRIREINLQIAQNYKEANRDPNLPEITIKQYYYLDVISRMNHPTYSDLAETFNVTKPTVTGIVNRLIHIGYLERLQSTEDRRVYHILVSEKGKRLIEIGENGAKEAAKLVEESLTEDEIKTYIELVEKIIANYTIKKF